jgi:protein SERAC1
MWLRDFLAEDVPHCRTMIYGYNSKLDTRGVDTIVDYSRGLLEEMQKIRNTDEVCATPGYASTKTYERYLQLRKRPVFFIAHSFGGIMLAQVFCLARFSMPD